MLCCQKISSVPANLNHTRNYPEFMKFAIKNRLDDLLNFFNTHTVEVRYTHDVGEIWLCIEGEMKPWSEVKQTIFGSENPDNLTLPHGWKYNQDGFVKKNMVKWTVLEPDWQDKTAIIGNYYIELVSRETKSLFDERHCWIRLIDNQASVISVGFYGNKAKLFPFRGVKGKLVSPDFKEIEPARKLHVTRIKVDASDYKKVKDKIELDQSTENIYFNFITFNCSAYACGLLKLIGIDINNSEFPSQAFGRRVLTKLNIKLKPWILKLIHFIAMAVRYAASPFYNLGIILMGGAYTSRDIRKIEIKYDRGLDLRPKPFSTFRSLFDGSNYKFRTGWKVTAWQKEIDTILHNFKLVDGSYDKVTIPLVIADTPLGFVRKVD